MRLVEVHIEVADVEKSLALYKKLLPHQTVKSWADGKAAALVLKDGGAFGIWQAGHEGIHKGRGGQHVHFAFQIKPDDYGHYYELIRKCGLEPLEYDWPNSHKSVYFFDDDGHQGEFITTDWIGLDTGS